MKSVTIFLLCCAYFLVFLDASCVYDGTSYTIGDTFPADDGCNHCLCTSTGNVSCTHQQNCPPGCEEGGNPHRQGDEWIAADGCNICWCSNNDKGVMGAVCTDSPCEPGGMRFKRDVYITIVKCIEDQVEYAIGDGWNKTDGCNGCTCTRHGPFCSYEKC